LITDSPKNSKLTLFNQKRLIMSKNKQLTPPIGLASMRDALAFVGAKSRNTLITWERTGRFPARVNIGGGRVGYRWDDLHRWLANLQKVEA
jgi:predicted DNA-binding transcriptional regulator AlpA